MAVRRSLSDGIGLFIRKTMEIMVSEYDKDPAEVESRYEVYKAIAEMAYMLSTCKEEGNQLVCSIALLEEGSEGFPEHGTLLRFQDPFEFRIDILEKMASSAGGENSIICVSGDSPESLKIIGIHEFNSEVDIYKFKEEIVGNDKDPLMNIRIKAPGVILSCLGPFQVLQFRNGATYKEKTLDNIVGSSIFKAKLFQDSSFVYQHVEDNLGSKVSFGRVSCYEIALGLILYKMLALAHGGMLVIVDDDFEESADVSIKYKFTDNDMLLDLVKEWQLEVSKSLKKGSLTSTTLSRKVRSICEFIAYLSTVDGAVIIKKNLQLVGYGAELKSGVTKSSITYYNIDNDTMGNFENKGTRHRSGCRYCYQDKEAVVFIVSQDGAVSGLTYYDGLYGNRSKERIPTNMVMLTRGRQILL